MNSAQVALAEADILRVNATARRECAVAAFFEAAAELIQLCGPLLKDAVVKAKTKKGGA